MITVNRYVGNPILSPNKHVPWEAYAVLNGSVVKKEDTYHMLYRAISSPQQWQDTFMHVSSVGHAESKDGLLFTNRTQFLIPEYEWERYGCEDPRITFLEGTYYVFYTAVSNNPPAAAGIRVGVALTKDFSSITEKHLVTPFNAKAMALFPEKIHGKYMAILTVDTDRPPVKIALAQFDTLAQLWQKSFWESWYAHISEHTIPLERGSKDHMELGLVPIKTEKGWLLIYSYIQNYFSHEKVFGIEAALLDVQNPLHVLGKTNGPFMVPEAYPELYGTIPNIIFPTGGIATGDTLRIFYGASDTAICVADVSLKEVLQDVLQEASEYPLKSIHSGLHLIRFEGNPLLSPHTDHPWEEKAVLNAGIFSNAKKTYIFYRAMDRNYISSIGLAVTEDGFHITERFEEPIYTLREPFEKNQSGRSAGCEDPRITLIGDTLHMFYTAYNGVVSRVAHTSISLSDFLARKWQWQTPQVLSNPSVMDKNAAIFPEKINGKYAILHRLDVRIWLDFVDNLSVFGNGRWLSGEVLLAPRPNTWDSEKVGIAGPPLKTDMGWLLFYHGISQQDAKYRLGIIVLDSKDPARVILRLQKPILEPKLSYETNGVRPGAIFSCGYTLIEDTLFVYYGAGDSTLCVSRIDYPLLLMNLKTEKILQES